MEDLQVKHTNDLFSLWEK